MKPYAENRKAKFEYETLETFEAGLVLTGQEVKSIRDGGAKLGGTYVQVFQGELWLIGVNIARYAKANRLADYDPTRNRKLLVTKKELLYLSGKIQEKGLTLVPFSLYPSGRRIKLSFGLCRGKKAHDKREKLKNRDLDRSIQRYVRGQDE